MNNFLFYFSKIIFQLNRLLGLKFLPNNKKIDNSPLGVELKSILLYHNKGDYLNRNINIYKLLYFVHKLTEISEYDNELLQQFKKSIRKTPENFNGIRFEISTAASLIRKKVNFNKTESPDFEIVNGTSVTHYIECGSIRVTKKKKGQDLLYKIGSVIRQKSKKPYCNAKTALFIDATNIFYNKGIKAGQENYARNYITEQLEQSNYGTIILNVNLFNQDKNHYGSNYMRIDNKKIDDNLLCMLDKHYPLGDERIYKFSFSSEG